jgi:hypothetical protein
MRGICESRRRFIDDSVSESREERSARRFERDVDGEDEGRAILEGDCVGSTPFLVFGLFYRKCQPNDIS